MRTNRQMIALITRLLSVCVMSAKKDFEECCSLEDGYVLYCIARNVHRRLVASCCTCSILWQFKSALISPTFSIRGSHWSLSGRWSVICYSLMLKSSFCSSWFWLQVWYCIAPIPKAHTCWFNSHPCRWTWVNHFPMTHCSYIPVLFNTIQPTCDGRGAVSSARSGGKVHSMRGNWCRDFEAGCPSCCKPVQKTDHWTSSFLQPPTDSWGNGRHSHYVCLQTLVPMPHQKHNYCEMFINSK